jgi:hypothetical protein
MGVLGRCQPVLSLLYVFKLSELRSNEKGYHQFSGDILSFGNRKDKAPGLAHMDVTIERSSGNVKRFTDLANFVCFISVEFLRHCHFRC